MTTRLHSLGELFYESFLNGIYRQSIYGHLDRRF